MGEPAKERFLDNANGMSLMYNAAYNTEHNNYLNFLARSRRNLAALIENPAWDKFDPASR
jgi:type IV pilus biogenesis protein CpaD/CtpE